MGDMIAIGNIVTLENRDEYLLLEESVIDNRKFIYSVKVLPDETPTQEYKIFESITINDEEYLKEIHNPAVYNKLVELFQHVVYNNLISGKYNDYVKVTEQNDSD